MLAQKPDRPKPKRIKTKTVTKKRAKTPLVSSIRTFRKYHKYLGIGLAIILLVSAVTGLLLGWKKDAAWIQPPSQKGQSTALEEWMPTHQLAKLASDALAEAHPEQATNPIDRLDVRPGKGMAKVLFEHGYWEVQIDGTTGAILSIDKRYSDFIEQIHDGSIISDPFKLGAMNILGIGLAIMIITGLWLWYGPRRVRAMKRRRRALTNK